MEHCSALRLSVQPLAPSSYAELGFIVISVMRMSCVGTGILWCAICSGASRRRGIGSRWIIGRDRARFPQ